jgi:hypothetical protein
MLPKILAASAALGLGVTKGKAKAAESDIKEKKEGDKGYWDDVCLVRFLEAVCWRYVAYPVRLSGSALLRPNPSSCALGTHVLLASYILINLADLLFCRTPKHAPKTPAQACPSKASPLPLRQRNAPKQVSRKSSSSAPRLKWTTIWFIMPVCLFHPVVFECRVGKTDVNFIDYELGRLLARLGDRAGAKGHFDAVLSGRPLEINIVTKKGRYSMEVCLCLPTSIRGPY